MRILVIEDDAALNGILAKRLAEERHSVDCCFDGRDGLDYAEAAEYVCIVLDWMLPKMDGLTLLRHQGQTLTRSQISDHVWNFDFDYDSNIVDVYIRYLRNKVDKPFPNKLIHTVRGFGYVMRCGDA